VFGIHIGLVYSQLAIVILAHRVAQACCRDKCSVLLAARNLKDRDVIRAESRQVMKGFAC